MRVKWAHNLVGVSALALISVSSMADAEPGQLAKLEKLHLRLVGHQHRLETHLRNQSARIGRLKRQPRSLTRDYQLRRRAPQREGTRRPIDESRDRNTNSPDRSDS